MYEDDDSDVDNDTLQEMRIAAWCAGYNAGQHDARANVYWRRFLRHLKYHFIECRNPLFRHEGWRWWKFWPDRS